MLSTAERVHRSAADVAVSPRPWRLPRTLTIVRPRPESARQSARSRRLLNVALALLGIIITAPVMMVVAALVKLTSRGPVLYCQQRVGVDRRSGSGGNWRRTVDYGGRLFTIYKFRTMTHQPAAAEDQVWAAPGDSRVTPVGRVLRKYRLDELPQLFNVLKGDMNVVGPRPEQPKIFLQLREQIDGYQKRQRVLPGITGLAQVSQSYDQDIEDVRRKLTFDLEYTARESAAEDLKIVAKTIPVVLFRRGGW